MRKSRLQSFFKVVLTVTFLTSVLPDPGKARLIDGSPLFNQNLATQSIFDPIQEHEAFKIKDLAIAESLVMGHLKMDASFLTRKGFIEENISEQTCVKYDFNNLEKIRYQERTAGYVLPMTIEYFNIQTRERSASRTYYVYITPESGSVTPFTESERDRLLKENAAFVHADRDKAEHIRAIIEHELWSDTPLLQLAANDFTVFGVMDHNVRRVAAFLKAAGAETLSSDFLSFVKEGRVYKVNREAEVDIPGYGKFKVSDDRIKVDHASNIGIYVKSGEKHRAEELQLVLIHETLARAGVISRINDNEHVKKLLEDVFTAFVAEDSLFENRKKMFSYAVNRAFEDHGISRSFEQLSFNGIDLNELANRDLSFPSDREQSLSMAKKAIGAWKKRHQDKTHWDTHPADSPAVSHLQKETLSVYNKYKLYELSVGEILEFAMEVFDGNSYPAVANEVEHIIFNLSDFNMSSKPHELTPNNFHEVARELGSLKFEGSFSEVNHVNFVFHRLIFDFFRTERRIAELSWMASEIQRERDDPGVSRLPMICAIQDLHGAATRAIALVGYAVGLKPNILEEFTGILDTRKIMDKFQELLKASGVNMKLRDIRYIGMNDMYDRGENPVGTFELVKWLSSQEKLKYILGNHDHWRAMGVLGVHRYFKEIDPTVDLRKDPHKGHSAPFWAEDAWVHAGWGPTEIDQVNEEKVNKQIRGINDQLRRFNDRRKDSGKVAPAIPLLGEINLRIARETFSKNVKIMKNYNHRIRSKEDIDEVLGKKLNNLKNAGMFSAEQLAQIENNTELELPDTLEVTMKVLNEKIRELNEEIKKINRIHKLDLWPLKVHLIDYTNYHKDPGIIERTLWQMKKFRLFYVDIFGFIHLHSVIPFNKETKKIDVSYMGQTGLEALELMQSKVQIFFEDLKTIPDTPEWRMYMMEEIGEIFIMVNSWYSDKTKIAKPKKVTEFVDAGGMINFTDITQFSSDGSYFSDRRPSLGWVFGHNERKKFDPNDFTDTPLAWMFPYPESETFQVLIDWQMSEGYKEQGGIFTVFKRDENKKMTGLRAFGFKDPKGTVIEDITTENLRVLSMEQEDFLINLSMNENYSEEQKELLRRLSQEDIDAFESDIELEFIKSISEDTPTYDILESDEAKTRMRKFMDALSRGKRFGLTSEQKQMIHKMSDGEWFMRWFQIKALKQVYEYADTLVEKAEEKGRSGKKVKLESRRDKAANELEKFGILIRPDIGNALKVIAELESQENTIFSEDEFFDLRVEEERSEKYEDVIPEKDKTLTHENMKKEVEQLLSAGFIEEIEGGYKATTLIAGLDKPRINALIDRVPELKTGKIDPETTDKLKDEVVKVNMDLLHEQKLGSELRGMLIEGTDDMKVVYHLIPEKLIPSEQRWIIQRIKNAERASKKKERIKFLSDSEYENLGDEAARLIEKGFLVDIALVNPTLSEMEKLNAPALKGKIKAFVFEQPDIGNFQQIEGIISVLRALYNTDRSSMINALNEINLYLTGENISEEIKDALASVNINDPLEMYKRGIKVILPPIEIHDWRKLRELNTIMQRILMQA